MNAIPQPRGLPPAGRFALLAALCSSVGQTFFIGLFGADFRAEFGLSDAAFGTLYSVATLAGGLLMFWLGGLADRFTLRRSVLLVLAMLALGALLVSASQGLVMLLAGLFLVRLAGQGLMGHLGVVAAGRYAIRRRGRALAMVSYGFILGEASLPPLVALALEQYDWRSVWLLASVVLVLVAMPLLAWLARPLTGNPAAQAEAEQQAGVETPLQLRPHRMLTHTGFLRVLAVVLVPPVLITALFLHQGSIAERQQWKLIEVGQAFIVFAILQALAAFLAGRLIDRFSARALLRVQLLPAAAAVLALGFMVPQQALWAMFAGLGLAAGLNGVIASAIWVELFGTRQLGMIRGVYTALMVLSTAAGPIVFGMLLDRDVALASIGLWSAAYMLLVPLLVTPGIRVHGRTGRGQAG